MSSKQIDFAGIIKKLKSEGSAQGFRALRDFFLANYDKLKTEFGPLGLMNLIMSFDKHAIFADMSSEKTKEQDHLRWRMFQDYINCKISEFKLPDEEDEGDDKLSIQEGEQDGGDGTSPDSP